METAKGETIEERWRAKAREVHILGAMNLSLSDLFIGIVHARRGFRSGRRNKGYFNCGELNHRQLPLKLHDTYRPAEILHCGGLYYFAAVLPRLVPLWVEHNAGRLFATIRARALSLGVHRCSQLDTVPDLYEKGCPSSGKYAIPPLVLFCRIICTSVREDGYINCRTVNDDYCPL